MPSLNPGTLLWLESMDRKKTRAGEMASGVKDLSCQHDDLGLDLHIYAGVGHGSTVGRGHISGQVLGSSWET